MKRYLALLAAVTAILALAPFALMWGQHATTFQTVMPFVPLCVALLTAAQHVILMRSMQGDARDFVRTFLGVTVGVLLLYLILIVVWALTHLATARATLIWFIVCYIVYAAFETAAILINLRQSQK